MAEYKCEHCGHCLCMSTDHPERIVYCPFCNKAMLWISK